MLEKIKSYYTLFGNKFQYFIHRYFYIITAVLITAISLAARFSVVMHPTRDVVAFVFRWMQNIKEVGFANFYTVESDYSPLFLFVVGIFAYLPTGDLVTVSGLTYFTNWMFYLKSFYFLVEIAIAIGIAFIIKNITGNKRYAWLGYVIYLCLPVQFFNSAIWGNADVLYFVCFVYVIYSILKGKDWLAFFLTGVCFGIKLQVVFILPFLLYLLISGKLKLYTIVFLPIGLFCTFLPAYLCGASFTEPFAFFARQVNGYSKLTLGCANIWHLINIKDSAMQTFTSGATLFGLSIIGLFTAIIFERKIQLTKENILCVGVFLMAIVPMFLPHMHERYFYLLDVLIVVYCLVTKKHYYLILLMQLSSGIAYHNYLAGRHFILALGEDSVNIASWINLFVLTVLFLDILKLSRIGSVEECAQEFKRCCAETQMLSSEKEGTKTCEVSVPESDAKKIDKKE